MKDAAVTSTKKPSQATMKRRIAEHAKAQTTPVATNEHDTFIEAYRPRTITAEEWRIIKPFALHAMRRMPDQTDEMVRQHLCALIKFGTWAHDRAHPLDPQTLLTESMIDGFVETVELASSTAASYRSRLRCIARAANPGDTSIVASVKVGHRSVKAPYTPAEVDRIVRVALVQPNPITGRRIAAAVGLGLGAGLDSADLRNLRLHHITDTGDDGINVDVIDRVPREVWVRRRFEHVVRRGLIGLGAKDLVVATSQTRRNLSAAVYSLAIFEGDVPYIEQGRLRTTWIADLLLSGVSLPVLMQAAGLTSARTITDVVALLPSPASDRFELRGGTS